MAKERTPTTSRRKKLLESMQILAKGVTHGTQGSSTSSSSGIIASISATVDNLSKLLKGITLTPPGSIDLRSYEDDGSIIPISFVPGPPGPAGPAGAAATGGGASMPYFMEPGDSDSIVPISLSPGPPGPIGPSGAEAALPVYIDPEDQEIIPFVSSEPGPAGATGSTGASGIPQASTVRLTGGNVTTSSTTLVDLTGATKTLTTGAHRCLVTFSCTTYNANTTVQHSGFALLIDGVNTGGTFGNIYAENHASNGVAISFSYLTDVLSAASHTFKIQWKVQANTGTVEASSVSPCVLNVIELGV